MIVIYFIFLRNIVRIKNYKILCKYLQYKSYKFFLKFKHFVEFWNVIKTESARKNYRLIFF